jgi:uncharacterized membrane protein
LASLERLGSVPRWSWLLVSLLGLSYLFLIPPFQIPDEPEHLARATQVAYGKLYAEKQGNATGGYFSSSYAAGIRFLSRVAHHGEQRVTSKEVAQEFFHGPRFHEGHAENVFVSFSSLAMYSPVPYLPQMIAIGMASAVNTTVVQGLYLARLFTYLAVIGILFFAVSVLGKGTRTEWQFFLVLSLPMALSQMASASADAVCIAVAFLNLALMIRLFQAPKNRLWFGLFLATTVLLSLTKLVFFVLPLAALAKLRGRDAIYLLAAAILPNFLWTFTLRPIYSPARLDITVDVFQQLQLILKNPLIFITAVWETLRRSGGDILSSFVAKMGWLDVSVRYAKEYFWIFLMAALWQPKSASVDPWEKWKRLKVLLLVCAFSSIGLVFLSQYLSWTALGANYVDGGVSGRYFFPIAPFLLVALPKWRLKRERLMFYFLGAAWFFIEFKAVWAVLKRYWMVL